MPTAQDDRSNLFEWLRIPVSTFRNARRSLQETIDRFRIRPVMLTGTWEEADVNGLPAIRHPPWMAPIGVATWKTGSKVSASNTAVDASAAPATGKMWKIVSIEMAASGGAGPAMTAQIEENVAGTGDTRTRLLISVGAVTTLSRRWPNGGTNEAINSPAYEGVGWVLSSNGGRLRIILDAAGVGATTTTVVTLIEYDEGALIVSTGSTVGFTDIA